MSNQDIIYQLQCEVMELGLLLAEGLQGIVPEVDRKQIEEYFEHNEYGEAIALMDCVLTDLSIELSEGPGGLHREISSRVERIESLYGV